jgi:hypothetical protein
VKKSSSRNIEGEDRMNCVMLFEILEHITRLSIRPNFLDFESQWWLK